MQRKILDNYDGFLSFAKMPGLFLKKKNSIYFICKHQKLVRITICLGQIKELSKENFVEIGNHSHTHEYLVDESKKLIEDDIKKSISIFKEKLGKNSDFFSYPFGEYSLEFKDIIKSFGFKYAFGQHSGVMDETKDFYELPRYPINEKYGEIKRFTSLTKTLPFKFKKVLPKERYLLLSKNPPQVKVEFYENIANLKSVKKIQSKY